MSLNYVLIHGMMAMELLMLYLECVSSLCSVVVVIGEEGGGGGVAW